MRERTDDRDIREIVETFSDMILRIAFQNTGNYSESEDIVQEVFFAMLKKRSFESEAHRKAWLIRVTLNKCKNYRKSARRRTLPLKEDLPAPDPPGVLEEILALPPDQRNAVYLHYYEGYTAREIGGFLHKSENAVCILLSRARKQLRLILEKEDD